MRLRRHARAATVALCCLAAAAVAAAIRAELPFDGVLFDLAIKARSTLGAKPPAAAQRQVAVVALDRRSLEAPELAKYPRTLMAPVWGTLLDTLFSAEARVVAYDLIFAYSANQLSPGFDRPFLRALSKYRDRVVIARSAKALPAPPFMAALRFDQGALGMAELVPDSDGVFRRVPATFASGSGESAPGLADAALRRAALPAMTYDVVIAPRQHLERIPTYALVDVLRCAETGGDALNSAFAGKIVFVGSTLPEEDRRLAPDRFLTPRRADGPPLHACGLRLLGASAPQSMTIPGVFLHAAAADAVAGGRITATAPRPVVVALAAAAALVGSVLGLVLAPWLAALSLAGVGLVIWGVEVVSLLRGLWVPAALPLASLAAAAMVANATRYLVEERRRRRIQHAFSHYLSPFIVDGLAETEEELRLGGEVREVTVMFADLSGFTAVSQKVPPEILMRRTNRYLAFIVNEVEATGGYVDKFIGDAVMAIWGAPVADPDHAVSAARAALRAAERVSLEKEKAMARGEFGFGVKIGLSSGPALVGNVGTERRYNYTAVGATVNIASRLEGVPGLYSCSVVVSQSTAEVLGDEFVMYELDRVVLKGVDEPMSIFEPLADVAAATPAHSDYTAGYSEALAQYRGQDFELARAAWLGLERPYPPSLSGSPGDAQDQAHPARVMAARAERFMQSPPPASWNGVWVMTSK